jgi:hypothetical protein
LFFADASTDRIGIGTSSPAYKLDVSGTLRATGDSVIGAPSGGFAARLLLGQSSANTEVCLLSLQNTATETATTGARIDFGGASNWLGRISTRFVGSTGGGNSTLSLYTASGGTIYERLLIDQNGNLGLGVTPSAWSLGKAIEVGNPGNSIFGVAASQLTITQNAYFNAAYKYGSSAEASRYDQAAGQHIWFTAPSGTAGNTITFTQAMTLDASGNLGVGTTSPGNRLHVSGNSGDLVRVSGAAKTLYINCDSGGGGIFTGAAQTGAAYYLSDTNGYAAIFTSSTERARISSSGDVFVAKTSDTGNGVGITLAAAGYARLVRSGNEPLIVNRLTNDGTLVFFEQDTVTEGSISVSGNTVSYNAFAGSHWSQLQDGSKPDILRGTVMESINELCVWPGEQNERLPKAKISDTAGSKKVYGVFMAWDNDWTETNDMYVTAVGAFICRVNGSVTVEEGDLLESNGDGTARVQADDIIRSSTIGKVTSTVKTHEYDDGSYCVPTVLYCG